MTIAEIIKHIGIEPYYREDALKIIIDKLTYLWHVLDVNVLSVINQALKTSLCLRGIFLTDNAFTLLDRGVLFKEP